MKYIILSDDSIKSINEKIKHSIAESDKVLEICAKDVRSIKIVDGRIEIEK